MAYTGKKPVDHTDVTQSQSMTVTDDLTVDTNTLHVDSTNNRVGIGTTSPTRNLHVNSGTGDVVARFESTDADAYVNFVSSGGEALVGSSGNDLVMYPAGTERMRITSAGLVGIGTTSPSSLTEISGSAPTLTLDYDGGSGTSSRGTVLAKNDDGTTWYLGGTTGSGHLTLSNAANANLYLQTNSTTRMTIDGSGNLMHGKTNTNFNVEGFMILNNEAYIEKSGGTPLRLNRKTNDGDLLNFYQDGTLEGKIVVSGTTVSYNGGHLARWSRLLDNTQDETILKGTVMTNLDEMVVWSHDAVEAVEAQDAVYDDDGNVVTEAIEAVEAKDAYTEDNEQLNCMAVSSVEGDPNVAGVFVSWDIGDDGYNDMNIAMTGDMVIRIAQGTTVARGDLLMSAGDGTAKPQGDDIVRSKTIAKVTSTNVSHTYDDGSYCVPCVLMAC